MNYEKYDNALRELIALLESKPEEPHAVYVPMPTTVFLLRRLNALCARNMLRSNWHVVHEVPEQGKKVTK